jgi:hypothetical protein
MTTPVDERKMARLVIHGVITGILLFTIMVGTLNLTQEYFRYKARIAWPEAFTECVETVTNAALKLFRG